MNFEKYISFTSTYKITKQKRELLPKHEQKSAPKFPNIMVCNYQAHSRLLLKQNYPMMTMRRTLDLYKVVNLERLESYILSDKCEFDILCAIRFQHETASTRYSIRNSSYCLSNGNGRLCFKMATSNDPKWHMQRTLYESFTPRTG